MNKMYRSLILVCFSCLLFSCTENDRWNIQKGSLSLLMDTKSGTDIPVIMKSTSTVDVDTLPYCNQRCQWAADKAEF